MQGFPCARVVGTKLICHTRSYTLRTPTEAEVGHHLRRIAEYLRQRGLLVGQMQDTQRESEATRRIRLARAIIDELADGSSSHLQRVTTEALAYLAYLKRIAPKKN